MAQILPTVKAKKNRIPWQCAQCRRMLQADQVIVQGNTTVCPRCAGREPWSDEELEATNDYRVLGKQERA